MTRTFGQNTDHQRLHRGRISHNSLIAFNSFTAFPSVPTILFPTMCKNMHGHTALMMINNGKEKLCNLENAQKLNYGLVNNKYQHQLWMCEKEHIPPLRHNGSGSG